MQAITRLNANDPVVWNDMNNKFGEIEARDAELSQQINVLKGVEYDIALQSGWTVVSNYKVFAIKIGKSVSISGFIAGGSDAGGSIILELPFEAKYQKKVELCNTLSIVGSATVSGSNLYMDACTDTSYVFFNFDYIANEV